MKNILKPAPRLIGIFILTMIISGGILTYLSINSITNFRELTEKKVSEEQVSVLRNLSVAFQIFLEEIAMASVPEKKNEAGIFVQNPFIVDRTGMFLKPWYLEESFLNDGPSPSTAYGLNLLLAQQSEFQRLDFRRALRYYQRSLLYAANASDSARSFNAMGRVHKNSENLPEAYLTYSLIASDYSSILDNNGFPYVYYAVLNLMEINIREDSLEIFPVISSFLHGTVKGFIPMNKSTKDILTEISGWKDNCSTLKDSQVLELESSLSETESYLVFMDLFGHQIKDALASWSKQEFNLRLGAFLAIHDLSADPGKIVLIDTSSSYFPGYCLDLDTLWSAFLQDQNPYHTEFEYELTLIRNGIPESANMDELIFDSSFSPYFPSSRITISLKDKNLIDTHVKRRSWSYGVALFLLLGAMLLGILLILRDIARERYLGQLRSDFVSNVSHELKTPLTSIHVFAESILLDRVKSSTDQKEYLKIILKETERLKRMINNILDFSKKEKGKVQYQARPVDVTALLKEALEDLSYWLEEMKFKVQTDLEEGVLTSGDQEALKQVVINLLDNAIKYSDKAKEINLRLSKDDKIIRIEVADKGMGIPEDQLEHIFDKFYRVNNSQVKGVGGTGLGLTVVKEIVEAHEGRIKVYSVPGKGSNFIIELNSM